MNVFVKKKLNLLNLSMQIDDFDWLITCVKKYGCHVDFSREILRYYNNIIIISIIFKVFKNVHYVVSIILKYRRIEA